MLSGFGFLLLFAISLGIAATPLIATIGTGDLPAQQPDTAATALELVPFVWIAIFALTLRRFGWWGLTILLGAPLLMGRVIILLPHALLLGQHAGTVKETVDYYSKYKPQLIAIYREVLEYPEISVVDSSHSPDNELDLHFIGDREFPFGDRAKRAYARILERMNRIRLGQLRVLRLDGDGDEATTVVFTVFSFGLAVSGFSISIVRTNLSKEDRFFAEVYDECVVLDEPNWLACKSS